LGVGILFAPENGVKEKKRFTAARNGPYAEKGGEKRKNCTQSSFKSKKRPPGRKEGDRCEGKAVCQKVTAVGKTGPENSDRLSE